MHCYVVIIVPVWSTSVAMSSEEAGMLRSTAVSMEAGSAHEGRAAPDACSLPVPFP